MSSPTDIETDPYENRALFCSDDTVYNTVTQGKIVTDENGKNIGVESTAVVNIFMGSPSSSIKMIKRSDAEMFELLLMCFAAVFLDLRYKLFYCGCCFG